MRVPTSFRSISSFSLHAPLFHHMRMQPERSTRERFTPPVAVLNHRCANDSHFGYTGLRNSVRILHRDHTDHARMVLSGRMADVCATLDHMTRTEQISAVH